MEIFRDLFLQGANRNALSRLGGQESSLPFRTAGSATRRRRRGYDRWRATGRIYCFTCSRSGIRQAALVFLTEREPGVFYVANVVPDETGQPVAAQYNAILEEFYERYARPCMNGPASRRS